MFDRFCNIPGPKHTPAVRGAGMASSRANKKEEEGLTEADPGECEGLVIKSIDEKDLL